METNIGKKVIIRGDRSGVEFGTLVAHNGREVTLHNARRIWYWAGAASLPQSAKKILMSRDNPHIDYTNQMLIINPEGRADSWVPSSSDVFAEDWELVTE